MAHSRFVLSLLVISVVQCYAAIPVFIWGDLSKPSLKSYPLVTISDQEFDALLKRELKGDPFTVVFVEKTLSVEDFSRKNAEGKTSFPYLQAHLGEAVYVPAVEDPLDGLSSIAGSNDNYIRLIEDGLSAKIEPDGSKFLFIDLKDAREGESRTDLLRRHNDFMQKIMTELEEKYEKVVAIYTAENPSWTVSADHNRVRRQANGTTDVAILNLSGLKLYVERVIVNDVDQRESFSTGTTVVDENKTSQNSTLTFRDYTLTFQFVSKLGYWMLNTIRLVRTTDNINEDLTATTELYSLLGGSYRCMPNVTFITINATTPFTLIMENLKVQPYFNSTLDPSELQFGDSFNCVGFFSVPIWAGLFVVFILLFIMFFGVMMMMDIRTMDRFDDPKGKTITINPLEQ